MYYRQLAECQTRRNMWLQDPALLRAASCSDPAPEAIGSQTTSPLRSHSALYPQQQARRQASREGAHREYVSSCLGSRSISDAAGFTCHVRFSRLSARSTSHFRCIMASTSTLEHCSRLRTFSTPLSPAGKQGLKSTSFGDASLSTHSSSSTGSRTVSHGMLLLMQTVPCKTPVRNR